MNRAIFITAALAVVALTLIPAILDGQRRFRWGVDTELVEMAERLREFPDQIGEWEVTESRMLDSVSRNQLAPIEYLNRIYLNSSSGKQVHVFVLLGPTGPTAAHTPDICFDSSAYRQVGDRKITPIDSNRRKGSRCYVSDFRSRDVDATWLRSWYAWTADGTWSAHARPRFTFANSRFLLKVQIVARYPDRDSMKNDEETGNFIRELERTLRNLVFYEKN